MFIHCRVYRYLAYRNFSRFVWKILGKRNRRVIPSCAVLKIRKTFPSEQYTGFQYPQWNNWTAVLRSQQMDWFIISGHSSKKTWIKHEFMNTNSLLSHYVNKCAVEFFSFIAHLFCFFGTWWHVLTLKSSCLHLCSRLSVKLV